MFTLSLGALTSLPAFQKWPRWESCWSPLCYMAGTEGSNSKYGRESLPCLFAIRMQHFAEPSLWTYIFFNILCKTVAFNGIISLRAITGTQTSNPLALSWLSVVNKETTQLEQTDSQSCEAYVEFRWVKPPQNWQRQRWGCNSVVSEAMVFHQR